jgi:hypothetical protein
MACRSWLVLCGWMPRPLELVAQPASVMITGLPGYRLATLS